jgi:hypothetical protein
MLLRAGRTTVLGIVALATGACGRPPLRAPGGHVGATGSAGTTGGGQRADGSAGTDAAGRACGAGRAPQYCSCEGIETLVGCGDPAAATCPTGCEILPPCAGLLDEGTCKMRQDCQAQECLSCGQLSFSCHRADEELPACPLHTCVKATCSGLNEAACDVQAGCTSVHCPDCMGGQVFATCAAPNDPSACGPCPPGAANGSDAGVGDAGREACRVDADCEPPNVCALGADAHHHCVARGAPPRRDECPTMDAGSDVCCTNDGDCTGGRQGACVAWNQIWCGGPQPPPGNTCEYDECEGDADCAAHPNGFCTAGFPRSCVYGPCRTSSDCTKAPGGSCVLDLIGEFCGVPMVFCRYANDPCRGSSDCPNAFGSTCVPNADLQGTICGIRVPPA